MQYSTLRVRVLEASRYPNDLLAFGQRLDLIRLATRQNGTFLNLKGGVQ